ncbi:MAG: hypothetical protein KatS3mg115_0278 [Candidatus Poribacteria bacterium]|nr:MAG: hypothetical protein KatS3mg115_0278 [Candidatus Poribacteria bacterium]
MAIEQDAAIVLRSFPYGEADRILLLGTPPRFGKLRVIAKGARRPKSRFGASAQPFQIGQAVFLS